MKRWVPISACVLIAVFAASSVVLAVDQASLNYQNLDSSAIPTQFIQNSTLFRVDGSIEPIVGRSNSVNLGVEHGSPLKEGITPPVVPPVVPPGGGGGGGGGGIPFPQATTTVAGLKLTLEYRSPTFMRTQMIRGERETAMTRVLVNGSENEVLLLTNGWQRNMPLFLGQNTITVQGITNTNQSKVLQGAIRRLLIGDVNLDHVVDDYDLSRLVRKWGSGEFMADFNEDGAVDDTDLSLLIAYWGVVY
jgi:hypothetical protein